MKLETKVGAFFIGSIAVLGVLILRTKKIELFNDKPTRVFLTTFDNVAGLNKQGHVMIAGVKVGQVVSIEIDKGRALIVFTVDDKVGVYRNASASLNSIGILGEKFIDLNVGDSDKGELAKNAIIPSKNGIGLDKLMQTVATIGEDVKGITYALNKSIGGEDGRAKLDEIMDNLRGITGEFRALAQENHGAINNTMANAEAITSDLRERLPLLAKQFEKLGQSLNSMIEESRPEMKGVMADVRKLAQSFQGTSDNLKSITDRINRGDGTIGKLLTDEATIQKLNSAVDNVNEMLGGMKKMDLRLDMNGSVWTKRDESQVALGLELAPSKDYWYGLGVSSTPDGKVRDSKRKVTNPDGSVVFLDQRSITTDRTVNFSATFNKRLGQNLVLNAGFIEGSGGAGAELRYFDDRFRMGALAYDFSKRDDKKKPRYRFTTSYQVWKGIYGQAGVQDIANKDYRSFFLGGGIRWRDEDLKKLVGLAGAAK